MALTMFLSLSTKDLAWGERIKTLAAQMGVTVYLAAHDVTPGADLVEKVIDHIEASDALIVLVTSHSVESKFVLQEIAIADTRDIPIIPLVHPDLRHHGIPLLENREHIEVDFDSPTAGLEPLTIALHKIVISHQEELARRHAAQRESAELAARRQRAAEELLVAVGVIALLAVVTYGSR